MIFFVFTFLRSKGLILSYSLEELLIDEVLGFLPFDLIGVPFANLFSGVSEKVEDSLENSSHLDNVHLSESHELLLPLLRC